MVTTGNSTAGSAATVAVRVKPGASRARVGGRYDGPLGPAVVVAVNAPPVDGRATEAARVALAKALGVRPGAVVLRSGAASRDKLFLVSQAPADLPERVRALRDGGTTAADETSGRVQRT